MNISMKKIVEKAVVGALALTMLLGFVSPLKTEAAADSIEIEAFSKAPKIDGVVDKKEWGEAAIVVKEGEENITVLKDHVDREQEVPKFDFKAEVYLGFDATHIYVAAVAEYDTHVNETTKPADIWKGDSLQLMLSATPGKDRNEFNMSCNSLSGLSMMDSYDCAGTFTMEAGEGKDYMIVRDGTTTTYELAISIDQLSKTVTEFKSGMELPFSFLFHKHDGYFVEYMAGIAREKDITKSGKLVLTGEVESSSADASNGDADVVDTDDSKGTDEGGSSIVVPIAVGGTVAVILIVVLVLLLFGKKKES